VTSHVIHSHPKDGFSNRPSSDDYYEAWKTKKTAGVPKEMMYDIGRDKFYGYEGSHPPTFERLKQPGSPETPPRSPGSENGSSSSSSSDSGS
jgi:hypothetical protein